MPEARRTVPLETWVAAVTTARDEGHTYLDWLTGVDETDAADDPGVEVVCRLLDPEPTPDRDQRSVLLRTRVPEGGALPSITGVFAGAAWHERETHEMFGVAVEGFTDSSGLGLRPLLLPATFEGTPLRKSFVLASRAARPWPGGVEPGEGAATSSPSRRRVQAPGVPGPEWREDTP